MGGSEASSVYKSASCPGRGSVADHGVRHPTYSVSVVINDDGRTSPRLHLMSVLTF